jgi:glycolate oxidase FAD binding subunit
MGVNQVGTSIDAAIENVRNAVRSAETVVPVGGRTQWEVGGAPPDGTLVAAPAGIVDYDPGELTVTLGAGTTVGELDAVVGEAGQLCPIDARDPSATVGGALAVGLSGHRRLRYGPLRNRLLEVHFVTADGRRIKGGGRTVKNVSGYDVARLLVGSFGTLGVIVQVTMRCEPRPARAEWLVCDAPGTDVVARAFRASSVLTDGSRTFVLIEGYDEDLAAAVSMLDGAAADGPPGWPEAAHRGRLSVPPRAIDVVGPRLTEAGVAWLGESGIGTVHVAAQSEDGLAEARAIAHAADGWLLREAGAPGLDGFGIAVPNVEVMARVKDALDPEQRMNPGRLPIPQTVIA